MIVDLMRATPVGVISSFLQTSISILTRPGSSPGVQFPYIVPERIGSDNRLICVNRSALSAPFTRWLPTLFPDHLTSRWLQCFPFYTYAEDGTNRRENITDWALEQFRAATATADHQVGHLPLRLRRAAPPRYRERYAANLRRELPRIPFVGAASLEESAIASASQKQIPPDAPGASRLRAARNDKGEGNRAKEGDPAKADATVFWAFVKAGQRL